MTYEPEKLKLYVVLEHDALGNPVIVARCLRLSHALAVHRLISYEREPYILHGHEMSDWWESMLPGEDNEK